MSFVLIVHGDHMGQKVQSPVLMMAEFYYCHVGAAHNGPRILIQ